MITYKVDSSSTATVCAFPPDKDDDYVIAQSPIGFQVKQSLLVRDDCVGPYPDSVRKYLLWELGQIIDSETLDSQMKLLATYEQICNIQNLQHISSIFFTVKKQS